eukprot:XP_019919583.1 PREDICTED: uncharacterized protein LOC105320321 [Crassostrea gigas]
MENKEKTDNLPTEFFRNSENRTGHTLLALKGILLVAASVLISSTKEISIAKPCDLERVLVSLVVDQTSPCKYDDIKKMSTTLCNVGISFLVLNAIFFLLILNILWVPTNKKIGVNITLAVSVVLAVVYSFLMIYFYTKVLESKERETETNYARIKSSMISRLEENYTSDNVTSGDAISDMWNKFFIEYECCAIDQVTGTNNDFDRTPWCTTSGSCQTTASQIPKTCCNYVTEDNYQSAPTACHSSVDSGTYKSNCMMAIKKLSTVHIKEYHVSLLLITLMTVGTLEIAECLLEGILISYRIDELWNFLPLIRNNIWTPKKGGD